MILKNKQKVLSSEELKQILQGLEFIETNSNKKGLVEDFYQTNRGYDELTLCIQEIPVDVSGGSEYQEFKLLFGNAISEIINLKFHTPLEFFERKTLIKVIKQNLILTDELFDLGFMEENRFTK